MPVGAPEPVMSRFGTTPGSFWCHMRRRMVASMLVRLLWYPNPVISSRYP